MAKDELKRKAKPAVKGTKTYDSVEMVDIPVPISAEALQKFSTDLVKASLKLDAHETGKREFLSEYREEHKALKTEHDRLRGIVNEKAAPKRMRCGVKRDDEKGEFRYYDPNTGKLLHSRPMTKEDRQLNVPGTLPPKHAGTAVTDKPPAGEEGKPVRGTVKEGDLTNVTKFPAPAPMGT